MSGMGASIISQLSVSTAHWQGLLVHLHQQQLALRGLYRLCAVQDALVCQYDVRRLMLFQAFHSSGPTPFVSLDRPWDYHITEDLILYLLEHSAKCVKKSCWKRHIAQ